jgi:hypothetical protein
MTFEQILAALQNLSTLDKGNTKLLKAAIALAYHSIRGTDPETGVQLEAEHSLSSEDVDALRQLAAADKACDDRLAVLAGKAPTAESTNDELSVEDEIAALDAQMNGAEEEPPAAKLTAEQEAAKAEEEALEAAAALEAEEAAAAEAAAAAAKAEAEASGEDTGEGSDEPLAPDAAAIEQAKAVLAAAGVEIPAAKPDDKAVADAIAKLASVGIQVNKPAAKPAAKAVTMSRATPSHRKPPVKEPEAPVTSRITAAGDVPGYSAGSTLTLEQAFEGLVGKLDALRGSRSSVQGTGAKFPVARIHAVPTDFEVKAGMNAEQVSAVDKAALEDFLGRSDEVVASGGCCVVAEREFSVEIMVDGATCFRSNFPRVLTPRGQVEFYPELCFDRANAGTIQAANVFSCADDAAGYPAGSGGQLPLPVGVTNPDFIANYPVDLTPYNIPPTPSGAGDPDGKGPCAKLPCITTKTHDTLLWTKCHDFGNWQNLLFPEFTRAWQELADVYHDVSLDEAYMAEYIAQSQLITPGALAFGATRSTLMRIMQIVARFKNTYRLPRSARFRLIVPTYFLDILISDLAMELSNDNFAQFRVTENDVATWLQSKGVNLGFYCDNAGTTTQLDETILSPLCAVGGAVTQLEWPASVRLFLHVEGEWIDRYTGQFDFGIIRDWAGMTQFNDFRMFSEEIRRLNRKSECCRSFVIDMPVCASGVGAGGVLVGCPV